VSFLVSAASKLRSLTMEGLLVLFSERLLNPIERVDAEFLLERFELGAAMDLCELGIVFGQVLRQGVLSLAEESAAFRSLMFS
jgi:hypothetical protein